MPALDLLAARAQAEVVKRSNWAGENPGVILVFCIVFIVGFGIVSLFVYRQWMAKKAQRAQQQVE